MAAIFCAWKDIFFIETHTRLINLGKKLVGLGESLQNEIEDEYETKGPPNFPLP